MSTRSENQLRIETTLNGERLKIVRKRTDWKLENRK